MARISTMMGLPIKLLLLIAAAGHCAAVSIPSTPQSDFPGAGIDKRAVNLANLESLGNNTLFEKWRPRYHFSAPAGWLNVCTSRFSNCEVHGCMLTCAFHWDRTPVELCMIQPGMSTI